MLCVDVNVLVDAFRHTAPAHRQVRSWLDAATEGPEQVAVLPHVGSAFIRLVTNRRVFREPTPPGEAIEFVDALLSAPRTLSVLPGRAHWRIFGDLVRDLHLTGDDVPDAFIAAAALDLGAALVTSDRGFRRFPGLRVVEPVAA
ncbi:MAG: TA system VapC family ribonuclease toxin [Candidatus Nanopelagicales bacterium]